MLDVFHIDESHTKSALLQIVGNQSEYRKHAHDAIFLRREQSGQEDADNQVEQLHAATA